MKTLLVLRHAKSSWKNRKLADHERPLNKRGKRDAPRMGQLLLAEELVPDLIISSTATRALTTAETVALACNFDGELQTTSRFYLASRVTYINVLQDVPDSISRAMVVGHNPGMAELVKLLTGESKRFPTAALAQIALPVASWQALDIETEGELINLWIPRALK